MDGATVGGAVQARRTRHTFLGGTMATADFCAMEAFCCFSLSPLIERRKACAKRITRVVVSKQKLRNPSIEERVCVVGTRQRALRQRCRAVHRPTSDRSTHRCETMPFALGSESAPFTRICMGRVAQCRTESRGGAAGATNLHL